MEKVIPFPQQADLIHTHIVDRDSATYDATPIKKPKPEKNIKYIKVSFGKPMPEGYPDYRPLLYRDGLFPNGWAVWEKEKLFIVYWYKSAGRFSELESGQCREQDLSTVMPKKLSKSIWFRDDRPDYMVFVAPDSMRKKDRAAYLIKLRDAGIKINLDYNFTLTKQKFGIVEDTKASTPITERLVGLLKVCKSQPERFEDEFDNFISALAADGTLDRWNSEKAKKKTRRVASNKNTELEVSHG